MESLCSIALVRERDVNNVLPDDDELITAKISIAEDIVNKYTGEIIFKKTYKEYYADDSNINIVGNKIFFRQSILDIISCTDFNTEIPIRYNKAGFNIVSKFGHKFTSNTIITGYFGYEQVPDNVKEAVAVITLWLFQNEGNLERGIKSEKVDFVTVVYGDEKLPSQLSVLLGKYMKKLRIACV